MLVILDARFTFTHKWHTEIHTDRDSLHAHCEITAFNYLSWWDTKPMKPKIYLNYIQEISLYHKSTNFIITTNTNQLMLYRKIIIHCSLSASGETNTWKHSLWAKCRVLSVKAGGIYSYKRANWFPGMLKEVKILSSRLVYKNT
jgi:hypothetical protein